MSAQGWTVAPLSAVAELYQGFGFPKQLQGRATGDLGFYKVSDISRAVLAGSEVLGPAAHCISNGEAEGLRATPLPKNSVVFARIGEAINLNRRALLPDAALIDNNVMGAKAKAGIADRYLLYYLKTVKLGELSQATTVPAVRSSDIAALEVPVAPSSEQLRIVSKLDELFSRIDGGERALEQVQKLVERYRQSVLKAAVTGELTREWREKNQDKLESGEALLARILKARREAWEKAELEKMKAKGSTPANDQWKQKYKAPSAPDTNGLPDLPQGWAWITLPMLCSGDITSGISVKGSNNPPGVPALRLDAMAPSGFDYSARRYIPITDEQARRLSINEGDFFVSRANGSLHLVGRAVLANAPPERMVFPDTMIRYRPMEHPNVRGWLSTVWPSSLVRSQLERRAKTTAGIYKVSQEDLSAIALPLPPLAEQEAAASTVAAMMSRIAKLEADGSQVLRQCGALRQAVLKSAFCGILVSQDPTDEPASALLERIAAERGADNAAPKRGRKNSKKKTTA